MARLLVVMGVSGCGKTTIGERLAQRLNFDFEDADTFHSAENRAKMAVGVPLSDADRLPWLLSLHRMLRSRCHSGVVLACSALKRRYRQLLRGGEPGDSESELDILFVHLKGSFEVIASRLASRHEHFMPSSLLRSQFDTLEEPTADENCLSVDVGQETEVILDIIANYARQ